MDEDVITHQDPEIVIKLRDLAVKRAALALIKEQKKKMIAAVTESETYKALDNAEVVAETNEKHARSALNDIAFQIYNATGNKKVHEDVTIMESLEFQIMDEDMARGWCFHHLTGALQLSDKVFIDAAKAGLVPRDLYTETKMFSTRIARDLTKYL